MGRSSATCDGLTGDLEITVQDFLPLEHSHLLSVFMTGQRLLFAIDREPIHLQISYPIEPGLLELEWP